MEHELETIGDILSVVNEKNIKGFLTDFGSWLAFRVAIRKVCPEQKNGEIELQKMKDSMTWIDDEENFVRLLIEISHK